jgi:carboxylesterase
VPWIAVAALAAAFAGLAVVLLVAILNAVARHRVRAETRAAADPAGPFRSLASPGEGDAGILLLHSISGTPRDFDPVLAALEARRIAYEAPMLGGERPGSASGVETTPASLAAHATVAYDRLAARARRIVVVGFSLGGVQAADVAIRRPVAGVVLLAPAFGIARRSYLRPSVEWWVRRVAPHVPVVLKRRPARIRDRRAAGAYRGFRTLALPQVVALMDYAAERAAHLAAIRAPALVVVSRTDDVVCPEAVERAYVAIGSAEKRLLAVERSGHSLLADWDRDEVTREVVAFIDACLGRGTSGDGAGGAPPEAEGRRGSADGG